MKYIVLNNNKVLLALMILCSIISSCGNKTQKIEEEQNQEVNENSVLVSEEVQDENQVSKQIKSQTLTGIDLGLPSGTIWASCNLGASEPWEFGDYYTLGVVYPGSMIAKDFREEIKNVDNYTILGGNPDYDAATAAAGVNWRCPTPREYHELREHCEWVWISLGGHQGYLIIGKNKNSIFLPAAGMESSHLGAMKNEEGIIETEVFGNYMLYDIHPEVWLANKLRFKRGHQEVMTYKDKDGWDHYANSIRAVSRSYTPSDNNDSSFNKLKTTYKYAYSKPSGFVDGYGYVDLGLKSGTKWAIKNLGAEEPIDFGDMYAWGQIEPNKNYSEDNYTDPPSTFAGIPKYDAATQLWGANWESPSRENFMELKRECKWVYISSKNTEDNNDYLLGIGPNNNTIIFPVGDYNRHYWTTAFSQNDDKCSVAIEFARHQDYIYTASLYKFNPLMIRPVVR